MGIIQAGSPTHPPRPRFGTAVLLVCGLGIALKLALLMLRAFPFHADEAVVGLMAGHILDGEWPAFFYGQAYMGSLDATLVALVFSVFGRQVFAIRLVQVLLYAGTIAASMLLAREVSPSGRASVFAGALLAIPAVNVTLYTTVSLGGYGEALLLGTLALFWALRLHRTPGGTWAYLGWGVLAGAAFWGFGITLVYTLPGAVLLVAAMLRKRPRSGGLLRLAALLAGLGLGAAAWLLEAVRLGPQVFVEELFGSAIAGVEGLSWLGSVLAHTSNLILFGSTAALGLRPPWEVRWLAWPLLPFAAGLWLLILADAFAGLRRLPGRDGRLLLLAVAGVLCLGFVLTPFGADPSGRYFLPLAPVMAIFAGDFLSGLAETRGVRAGVIGLLLLLAFNLWGTLQSAARNPPGITTQFSPEARVNTGHIPSLASLLERMGEVRGYSHYWVAYPLAFASEEQVVFAPRLPYHADLRYTSRDDRYPPYRGMVEQSQRVAYITTGQPALEQSIRSGLQRLGVSWKEARLGEFHLFYGLGRPVHPAELGLPE